MSNPTNPNTSAPRPRRRRSISQSKLAVDELQSPPPARRARAARGAAVRGRGRGRAVTVPRLQFSEYRENFRKMVNDKMTQFTLRYLPAGSAECLALTYTAKRLVLAAMEAENDASDGDEHSKAVVKEILRRLRPKSDPGYEAVWTEIRSRSPEEIRAMRQSHKDSAFVEEFLPQELMEEWGRIQEQFIKHYYWWRIYSTPYEMEAFIGFMERHHSAFWEVMLENCKGRYIKPPTMRQFEYPSWKPDQLKEEVAEYLRLKNNATQPSVSDKVEANSRVRAAYHRASY